MLKSDKDADAETAIRLAILAVPGLPNIERVLVLPGEDHDGAPALSVTLFLKTAQGRMSGSQLLDAIMASATALREIGDDRFPYVTFLEPEDERESPEGARPAA